MNEHREDLGREGYAAYGATTDFKNYQGLDMPRWDQLPPKIQEAWMNAAAAVEQRVLHGELAGG